MQLDTGATVTLLAETIWEDIDCPKLQPSDIKLQTYSQQEIPLMGQCLLQFQCQGRSAKLLAVVSKGNRQNLLGRTWIDALELDLNEIYHMNQVQNNQGTLNSLSRCYSTILQDGLGRYHKVKVSSQMLNQNSASLDSSHFQSNQQWNKTWRDRYTMEFYKELSIQNGQHP